MSGKKKGTAGWVLTSAVRGVQGGLQDSHPGHDDGGKGAAPDQRRTRPHHAALLHRAGGQEKTRVSIDSSQHQSLQSYMERH